MTNRLHSAKSLKYVFLFCLYSCVCVLAQPALACNFCMLNQGVSPLLAGGERGFTLDVNYMHADQIYDGSSAVDSLGKKEGWLVYSLTGFYSFTDDLTVSLTVPYTIKSNIDYDEATNQNTGTVSTGIGDLALTGRYTFFRKHSLETTYTLGALGGIKFPTGSTKLHDHNGDPVDRHALPGTGSWDFDVGTMGTYSTGGGFQLTADVVYRIAGAGDWDGRGHRFGNSLNYSVKGFQRVWQNDAGTSFRPWLGVTGETTAKEKGAETATGYDSGQTNPSSGGTVVYADLGLYSIFSVNTLVNFSVSKSFYRDMNFDKDFDADPSENYKIDLSVTYLY